MLLLAYNIGFVWTKSLCDSLPAAMTAPACDLLPCGLNGVGASIDLWSDVACTRATIPRPCCSTTRPYSKAVLHTFAVRADTKGDGEVGGPPQLKPSGIL